MGHTRMKRERKRNTMARIDQRAFDQLRPMEIIPNIGKFAEGSCLIRCGNTHVLCCSSV